MRVITEKDKRALLVALRTFVRAHSGERISQKAGEAIVERALDAGVSIDVLLNHVNWGKASELMPGLLAKDYVDMLAEKRFDARPLKEEPLWHEPDNGFGVLAEAAHDFFMEITGRGGRWNIPSALKNLAKIVERHSLQAVLSEALIEAVLEREPETNYYGYLSAIANDFKSLPIDDTPTQAQQDAEKIAEETIEQIVEEPQPGYEAPADEADQEEDAPYPEEEPEPQYETTFLMQGNPRDLKRECLRNALGGYSPVELSGLIETIEGGQNKVLSEIIDALVDGHFDPSLESTSARDIHRSLSADLLPSFIDCVRMQGFEMDENTASHYDILHDNWDLRTPEVRKLHKLKRLILTFGKDDEDLLATISDLEDLYGEK